MSNNTPKAEPTLADTIKEKRHQAEPVDNAQTPIDETEDEGLPSVNRRKSGNKLVNYLGMAVIVIVGLFLIVAINSDKSRGGKKKEEKDKIDVALPKLTMPAPPPISFQEPPKMPTAPTAPTASAQPIQLKPGTPNAKAPMEWYARKMGGNVTHGSSASSTQNINQYSNPADNPASPESAAKARAQANAIAGQPGDTASGLSGTNRTGLGSALQSTSTPMAVATHLPNRNFLLAKGANLDCALETALNSTLPGITTCRITRDVYSDNGQVLLMERGTQLVGEYAGGMKQGQVRLFVLWTRAKTPNGVVISLNSPGADALGRSGMDGWVDNHFIERFGAAILMTFLQGTLQTLQAKESNSGGSTSNVYYGSNSSNGPDKIVEKILESTVNIPPTLVKNQGEHIQVMVARDLDFSGVYGLEVSK